MNLLPTGRDGGEIEAFIVDRYLDSLLARQPLDRIAVDRNVLATANRLTDGLPRFHPSFGFEERLLGQLGALAATLRGPAGAARNEPPVSAIGEARRRPFPVVPPLVSPAVLGRGAPPVRPV
ncbi:MAG: hypothetical protein H0U58_01730, partial [Chloroflexi bacterium]|nr:hypothetical protein [Chloroflexota bacterium]